MDDKNNRIMIDKERALEIANAKLKELEKEADISLEIIEEETIKFESGWMFFYQSKKFLETNNFKYMIGGNAPIIVDCINTSVHLTGTSEDEQYYIERYNRYREDIDMFYKENS